MKKVMREFWANEDGLELAEYVVAASLIALAVVLAFTNLGSSIIGALEGLTSLIRTS